MPAHPHALRQPAGFFSLPRWMRLRPGRTALAALLGLVLISSGCAFSRLQTTAELSREARPFSADPPAATHRLLIVGDGSAVGTGASAPSRSLAGLIAARHPDWRIDNRARNGARCSDMSAQLADAGPADTVLILCGRNDVTHLGSRDDLHDALLAASRQARALAPEVILLQPGDVGQAPFFLAPLSWWMNSRSRELQAIGQQVAQESGARQVRLSGIYAADTHAADGLHLNDAGYARWFAALQEQAGV
jgi:lysophospholipase L1-like esterase